MRLVKSGTHQETNQWLPERRGLKGSPEPCQSPKAAGASKTMPPVEASVSSTSRFGLHVGGGGLSFREIPLTKGKVAIVDACDYEELSKHRWHCSSHGYAARTGPRPIRGIIYMHQEVLGKIDGFQTDHANGNGLDNRRANLRHCTGSQNLANQKNRPHTSRYRGVSWWTHGRLWRAGVGVHGKQIWLGYRKVEEEAAHLYDEAARRYFGEFAKCNFEEES